MTGHKLGEITRILRRQLRLLQSSSHSRKERTELNELDEYAL